MKTNNKISIVIPIYKVEKYLSKCLDSIIGQTYRNIEVLLVDDGSPDGCGAICDEYAKQDARISVYHIPNGGVAKARQLGVERSSGEYIIFVDPDDWLPLDSVEILHSKITDDVDIVIGSRIIHNKGEVCNLPLTPRTLGKDEYLNLLLAFKVPIVPWGKIYRRSLFDKESFPKLNHTEDMLMNLAIGFRVRGVKIVDDLVYNYLMRYDSTARKFQSTFEYEKNLCLLICDILAKNNALSKFSVPYSKGATFIMYRPIISCNRVNSNDQLILDIRRHLKGVKLPITTAVKLKIISSPLLQMCAHLFYRR